MDGIIKVTPEELINTANTFNSKGAQVQALTNAMLEEVRSLNSSWEGEAATAYITQFTSLSDDMDRMYSMIQEHVKDLNEMAEQYKAAETANEEIGASLAGDIIS